MYLSILCFAFPVKLIMTLVYASKTKTAYKPKTEDLFDFVISSLISLWIYINWSYSKHESSNLKIA